MRHSRYLSYSERLVIERMLKQKATQKQIAAVLGVSQQAISKELQKGKYIHTGNYKDCVRYSADVAQKVIDEGKKNKGTSCKFFELDSASVDTLVYCIKKKKLSPYAALRSLSDCLGYCPFSLNSLYKYIKRGFLSGLGRHDLPELWRKREKKPKSRICLKKQAGKSIELRPDHINDRSCFGHWEGDCVIGKRSGVGEVLLTLTERKSRFEMIFKMDYKRAVSVVSVLDRLSDRLDFQRIFKSITFDNGSEFSDSAGMEFNKGVKRTDCFYAHPYSSFERGTNERHNRIIRRFFPKGASLAAVTQENCVAVARWMNNLPRRILGGLSPAEVLQNSVDSDIYDMLAEFF